MSSKTPPLLPQQLDEILKRYGNQQQRVRYDVYTLMRHIPTLLPREDTLVSNDGQAQLLLLLDGTIPISYLNSVYYIPVNLWIIPTYPLNSPICFVVPTKDMVIKSQHKNVDTDGRCYLPYLTQWKPEVSNLVDLITALTHIFGVEPPVFQKPDPPPPPYPSAKTNGTPTASPTTTALRDTSNSTLQTSPPQSRSPDKDVLMKRKLTEKLHQHMTLFPQQYQKLLETNEQLQRSSQSAEEGLKLMHQEQLQLEERANVLNAKVIEVSNWLQEAENQRLDIDEVVKPSDVLSTQMFDCVAADASIEDTLYWLSRALEEGKITLEVYLKLYRTISRDQFFHKAVSKKIFDLQQAPPAYPFTLELKSF